MWNIQDSFLVLVIINIYFASGAEIRTATECEGATLSLYCEEGTKIKIESARYGRFDTVTCGYSSNIKCSSSTAGAKVKDKCNNKKECKHLIAGFLFGNPCPQVPKYMEVKYSCESTGEDDQVEMISQSSSAPLIAKPRKWDESTEISEPISVPGSGGCRPGYGTCKSQGISRCGQGVNSGPCRSPHPPPYPPSANPPTPRRCHPTAPYCNQQGY